MNKTLLIVAIFSAVSGTAYAADNGFYAGVQAGYGNSGYTGSDILPSASSAMAAANNTLINDNNFDNAIDIWNSTLSPTSTTSSTSSGTSGDFAGRLFLGYQFNPYFALEAGYLYLTQNLTSKATYNGLGPLSIPITASVTVKSELSPVRATDLAAKFMLPLQNTNFYPYLKVGVAYVDTSSSNSTKNASVNIQGINSSLVNFSPTVSNEINVSEFCPEGTLGINYDMTKNISIDASWTLIHSTDTDSKDINFASVGFIYHFT